MYEYCNVGQLIELDQVTVRLYKCFKPRAPHAVNDLLLTDERQRELTLVQASGKIPDASNRDASKFLEQALVNFATKFSDYVALTAMNDRHLR